MRGSLDASDTKLETEVKALSKQASQFSDKQKEVLDIYAQVRESTSSLEANDVKMTTELTALTIQASAFHEKQNEVLESHAQVSSRHL